MDVTFHEKLCITLFDASQRRIQGLSQGGADHEFWKFFSPFSTFFTRIRAFRGARPQSPPPPEYANDAKKEKKSKNNFSLNLVLSIQSTSNTPWNFSALLHNKKQAVWINLLYWNDFTDKLYNMISAHIGNI